VAGKYDLAEPLLKQSLEISGKVYGENDPDFVTSLNNLASLYADTGRYAEADTLYLRALDTIRAGVGEESAFFVKSLNNLAQYYYLGAGTQRLNRPIGSPWTLLEKPSARSTPHMPAP
jgi:tetratricopeptide (TPR) repeat protein